MMSVAQKQSWWNNGTKNKIAYFREEITGIKVTTPKNCPGFESRSRFFVAWKVNMIEEWCQGLICLCQSEDGRNIAHNFEILSCV